MIADEHGAVLHLFERECSVQRRHQKVIEESPSPNVTPALRQRLTESAIAAARASSYRNAGTVEFLVDLAGPSRDRAPFHFLEMNTRLQVEHGVTEQVTGVDLVRAQLLVASGEPLPWRQADLIQRGHAIEARVYAEDPEHGFLPQAGRLLLYREPRMPGVRVDSGVREGDEISVHYDPLIAKVIAQAETRDLAIARLVAALRAFPVLGIITNIPFLIRVLEHPSFQSGDMHTGFLDHEGATLADSIDEPTPRVCCRGTVDGRRRARTNRQRRSHGLGSLEPAAGLARMINVVRIGEGVYRVEMDGRAHVVYVAGPPANRWAFWNGRVFRASQADAMPCRPFASEARCTSGTHGSNARDGSQGVGGGGCARQEG